MVNQTDKVCWCAWCMADKDILNSKPSLTSAKPPLPPSRNDIVVNNEQVMLDDPRKWTAWLKAFEAECSRVLAPFITNKDETEEAAKKYGPGAKLTEAMLLDQGMWVPDISEYKLEGLAGNKRIFTQKPPLGYSTHEALQICLNCNEVTGDDVTLKLNRYFRDYNAYRARQGLQDWIRSTVPTRYHGACLRSPLSSINGWLHMLRKEAGASRPWMVRLAHREYKRAVRPLTQRPDDLQAWVRRWQAKAEQGVASWVWRCHRPFEWIEDFQKAVQDVDVLNAALEQEEVEETKKGRRTFEEFGKYFLKRVDFLDYAKNYGGRRVWVVDDWLKARGRKRGLEEDGDDESACKRMKRWANGLKRGTFDSDDEDDSGQLGYHYYRLLMDGAL